MRVRALRPDPAPTLLALLAMIVAPACVSSRRVAYSPYELKTEIAARVPADRLGDVLVPYQPTPEMIARAKDYTGGLTTDHGRAELLVRSVTDESQFGIEYDPITTTLPAETLAGGRGNCLSMTSFYVGLARAIGLSAYYVDASDRVNDISRDSDLIVDTGHIAATVRTERGWTMVDFTGELTNFRTFRVIDDIEALAHFYNNRGYEILRAAQQADEEEPWHEARRDFLMATYVMPEFARAQNNLGVANSRLGDTAGAERAYKASAAAEKDFAAARHNLGNFYLRKGDLARAIHWYTLAIDIQKDNPFVHYHLGLALYQSGDVAASIERFERAIKLKHDYREPRNLLAQAYRSQGRHDEANRILNQIQ